VNFIDNARSQTLHLSVGALGHSRASMRGRARRRPWKEAGVMSHTAHATGRRGKHSANGSATIEKLSREEGQELLDRQARKFLNMSGEQFARDYRAGRIKDPHRLVVARVAILLPLVED
jgi:hypothetical protein